MPLDDTTGLLDRKDKVKPEVFSIEGLRDWLLTKDPSTTYDYYNCVGSCLIHTYLRECGADQPNRDKAYTKFAEACLPYPASEIGSGDWAAYGLRLMSREWTYGAALARCEAYLSTTSGDGGE